MNEWISELDLWANSWIFEVFFQTYGRLFWRIDMIPVLRLFFIPKTKKFFTTRKESVRGNDAISSGKFEYHYTACRQISLKCIIMIRSATKISNELNTGDLNWLRKSLAMTSDMKTKKNLDRDNFVYKVVVGFGYCPKTNDYEKKYWRGKVYEELNREGIISFGIFPQECRMSNLLIVTMTIIHQKSIMSRNRS